MMLMEGNVIQFFLRLHQDRVVVSGCGYGAQVGEVIRRGFFGILDTCSFLFVAEESCSFIDPLESGGIFSFLVFLLIIYN